MAHYTVKQLADLAGVTRRTLHYYDRIGLLNPTSVGKNGYRVYTDPDLLQLQQIMFYREIGFSLSDIQRMLNAPEFDLVNALKAHRNALTAQAGRLNELIETVDQTILHIQGDIRMKPKKFFEAFDDETQKKYEEEAMQRWDPRLVKDSNDRWRGYSREKQQAIMDEAGQIYLEIVSHMDEGPESDAVQAAVARWHQNLRNFYEPTIEILRRLGMMYAADHRFAERFASIHPELPAFLPKAIGLYCDRLESSSGECQ